MKKPLTLIILFALVPLLLLAMAPNMPTSIHDDDDDDDDGTVKVDGVAVTGFNRLLSQPRSCDAVRSEFQSEQRKPLRTRVRPER